jgi:hypothetical protein
MPKVNTPTANTAAPTYTKLMRPLGAVASGDTTEKKKPAGTKIVAVVAQTLMDFSLGHNHIQRSERMHAAKYGVLICPRSLVQLVLPIRRHSSGRSRHRLI